MAALFDLAKLYGPIGTAASVSQLPGAIGAFRAAPSVKTAWGVGGSIVGVLGTEEVVGALVKFGVRLALKARKADEGAGEEAENLARERVPEDTGRLLNGIEWHAEDNAIVFTASAVKGDFDYARIVEFGRKAKRVADDSYFDGDGSMEAQPFFYNSVREALEHRGIAMEEAIGGAADEAGL